MRFDVWTLVNCGGIGVVDPTSAGACRTWLERQGYVVERWEFENGIGPAVVHLGRRLRWEEQFGYTLSAESRNLNALRDGFVSDEWHSDALVLELHQADQAWREEPDWLLGVLSIAREYSLWQLAVGRRFFVVLILEKTSPLIGQTIEVLPVPHVYAPSGPTGSKFRD
jgi:hypothetical protein